MKRVRGFTLIELMVAVALGLLAILVIAQVFQQSEGNKRDTTSGSDAQVAGALALFALQQDIQMAGYGLAAMPAAVGCPTTAQNNGAAVLTSAPLAPVSITVGSGTASDSLTVLYSQGVSGYSVPLKVASTHAVSDSSFQVPSTWGVTTGDMMVAVPAAWVAGSNECTLFQATSGATDTPTTQLSNASSSLWNTNLATIMPSAGYPAGSALLNLGSLPVRRTYTINTNTWSLQGLDFNTSAPKDLFPQIVLMKALYGMATTANGAVTSYTNVPPTTNAGWRLVQSIRLVIVARSAQKGPTRSTDPVLTPSGSVTLQWNIGVLPVTGISGIATCNTSSQCVTLDVSGTDSDWKYYRYKVFDTVIPLRNAVWNQ